MGALLIGVSAILLSLLQTAIGNTLDIVFLFLVSAVFFSSRTSALIIAWLGGLFLDLYAPFFGISLVVLPIFAIVAVWIRTVLLTDASFIAFEVLAIGGYITLRIMSFSIEALIRGISGIAYPLGFLSLPAILFFVIKIGCIALGAAVIYGIMSRFRHGYGYVMR
jgi:hypothetical protein